MAVGDGLAKSIAFDKPLIVGPLGAHFSARSFSDGNYFCCFFFSHVFDSSEVVMKYALNLTTGGENMTLGASADRGYKLARRAMKKARSPAIE